jgi:hypothetical protein
LIACLLVWLSASCVAWLVGTAVLRVALAAGLPGPKPSRPVTMLLGLCCVTVLGGVGSLFGRLGSGAMAAGCAVLVLCAATLALLPKEEPSARRSWPEIALIGLVAAIAVAQTASPPSVYDTGLYHIQAIRWIEQHAAVPGLANLHFRLAFAAPWFEAQALFDPAILGGRPAFALNGWVFVTAVSFFLGGIASTSEPLSFSQLLRWGSIPAAFWLLRRGLSSASPDVAVALFSWVVLLLLAEKLEAGTEKVLDRNALVIATLAIFAAVTKLSAIPLLLAPASLVARNLRHDRRRALALCGVAAAVAAPFFLRNVILSGYWLFPATWSRVPGLAWTVPPETAAALVTAIRNWARLPNRPYVSAFDFAAWVPTWIHYLSWAERMILAALPVLALIHVVRALRKSPAGRQIAPVPGYPILVGIALTGTLFWLINAPDPRFGWSFFPFLTLLLAAPLLRPWIERLPLRALALALTLILLDQGRRVIAQEGASLAGHWLWPAPPPAVATRTVVLDGLKIQVPVAGEQCWDAPLPCAPLLDPALAPRGANLDAGFLLARSAAGRSW